jgi:hypothetical protein
MQQCSNAAWHEIPLLEDFHPSSRGCW